MRCGGAGGGMLKEVVMLITLLVAISGELFVFLPPFSYFPGELLPVLPVCDYFPVLGIIFLNH